MSSRERGALCKRWAFNWTDIEYDSLCKKLSDLTTYYIIGKETCSRTGTKHLQGFFSAKKRYRLSQLKCNISSRIHFETTRSTVENNIRYCKKEGDFIEIGQVPSGPQISSSSELNYRDIVVNDFRELIQLGKAGLEEFIDRHPTTYYYGGDKFLKNYFASLSPMRRDDIKVLWLYGPTGTGKSRIAHDLFPNAYPKDSNSKWWDGYLLEKECIIDGIMPDGIDIDLLSKWFDRYRCLIEIKYGMAPLCVETFIITSNFQPFEVYPRTHPLSIQALERRMIVLSISDYDQYCPSPF